MKKNQQHCPQCGSAVTTITNPQPLPAYMHPGILEPLFTLKQARLLIPCQSESYFGLLLIRNKSKLSPAQYMLHGSRHNRHRMLTLSDLMTLRALLIRGVSKSLKSETPSPAIEWVTGNMDELVDEAWIVDSKNP